jgi:hypothetical protein
MSVVNPGYRRLNRWIPTTSLFTWCNLAFAYYLDMRDWWDLPWPFEGDLDAPSADEGEQSRHNEMRWMKVRGAWLLTGSFLPLAQPQHGDPGSGYLVTGTNRE